MADKINIEDRLDEIKNTKPSILKCSYPMARMIRQKAGELIDLNILSFLNTLTIQPSDKIPDHIIFLCDNKGFELRMINLTERKAFRKAGVKKEKLIQ